MKIPFAVQIHFSLFEEKVLANVTLTAVTTVTSKTTEASACSKY